MSEIDLRLFRGVVRPQERGPYRCVTTTRGDVHYVVTEHGVAYLHGKNVQERALALISIAHPDFREGLVEEAIDAHYLSSDLADFTNRMVVGPKDIRTTLLLDDGTQLVIRSIHPTDESKLRGLFLALSQESLYTRFMGRMKWLPHRQLQEFVYIDHRSEVSIVATLPEAGGALFVSNTDTMVPVPLAHLVGAAVGILVGLDLHRIVLSEKAGLCVRSSV